MTLKKVVVLAVVTLLVSAGAQARKHSATSQRPRSESSQELKQGIRSHYVKHTAAKREKHPAVPAHMRTKHAKRAKLAR
jgi:uncharacterized MAPEG superfamily protein